jgi:hypothetical protein
VLRDLVRAHARPWELDHRPAEVLDVARLLGRSHGELAQAAKLLGEPDEWVHDLDEGGLAGAALDRGGGAHDRPHLHLVDLRVEEPEPAAARPQHRIRLLQRADAPRHLRRVGLVGGRKELVQGRVEQPDRHGEPRHGLEDPLEVLLLERQQPVERLAALLLGGRHDHRAHERQPLLGHEHVLGSAEADALRPELTSLDGILRRVRVGAHLQPAELVGPAEQPLEVLVDLWRDEIDLADDDVARAAVDRDHVSFGKLLVPEGDCPLVEVDREPLAAGDARLPHAASDHGRV